MNIQIQSMQLDDYEEVFALWQETEGIGLSASDSRESIGLYLKRNPGLSLLARSNGSIVATVMCGHDGRRGYLHHLVVAPESRRRGIGKALVERSLHLLKEAGIQKCHIFVVSQNEAGIAFWNRIGWGERAELTMLSRMTSCE